MDAAFFHDKLKLKRLRKRRQLLRGLDNFYVSSLLAAQDVTVGISTTEIIDRIERHPARWAAAVHPTKGPVLHAVLAHCPMKEDILRALLDARADPNSRCGTSPDHGKSALATAVWCGCRKQCIRALLEAGADPHERDPNGDTYLHQLTRNFDEKSHMDGIDDELIRAGADVNAQNKLGQTPLHLATVRYFPYLLSACADPRVLDNGGKTTIHGVLSRTRSFNISELIRSRVYGKRMKA